MLPRSYCHARLPNAGLGNKLFVWAKAHLFASLNELPLVVTGWTRFQAAPLRYGGDLRLYWNYFRSVSGVNRRTRLEARLRSKVVSEPAVARTAIEAEGVVYEFSRVPPWADYFGDIRASRDEVRRALFHLLSPARRRELAAATPPVVCAHVRMGDYRPLAGHESFKNVGLVRTPLEYFRDTIQHLRDAGGTCLPVEIVSDGNPRDLASLLDLPGVSMGPRRSAIVDLMVMSRSQILIASAGSTFSTWAGFIGDCALIHHPDHVHKPVRPAGINSAHYEGPLVGPPDRWPSLFLRNLSLIADPSAMDRLSRKAVAE